MRLVGLLGVVIAAGVHAATAVTATTDWVLTNWTTTTVCDASLPMQLFTRQVITEATDKSVPCPPLTKSEQCQPIHCEMSEWSAWTACLADGSRHRSRTMVRSPALGGRECPSSKDSVACCEKDCLVSDWSEWQCNKASGNKTRTRTEVRAQKPGGAACPSSLVETTWCDPYCDSETTSCTRNAGGRWTRSAGFSGNACPSISALDECSEREHRYCDPLTNATEKARCVKAMAASGPYLEKTLVKPFETVPGKFSYPWECAEKCAATSGCKAYSYHTADPKHFDCWLSTATNFVQDTRAGDWNFVSGIMLTPSPSTCKFQGFGFFTGDPLWSGDATSSDDCCRLCTADSRCKAFTFYSATNRPGPPLCSLHPSVGQVYNNGEDQWYFAGTVSGR